MRGIKKFFQKRIRDEKGATATEYAVMLVLIIVVALATIIVLGTQVEKGFNTVAASLVNAQGT